MHLLEWLRAIAAAVAAVPTETKTENELVNTKTHSTTRLHLCTIETRKQNQARRPTHPISIPSFRLSNPVRNGAAPWANSP